MLNVSSQSQVDLLQTAMAHHQAGQLPQAEAFYRQILARDPRHADAWHHLGVLACQVGQNQAAIALIESAIAINPRHPAYHSNLGEALRKAGNLERAERALRQAIEVDANFGDAYTNLAVIFLQQERFKEAAELLQECVQRLPGSAHAWRLLGDALAKSGRMDSALIAYERALAINPELNDARFNLAATLLSMGRPVEAAERLRAVVATAPGDMSARLALAEAYYCAGNLNESVAEYHRAVDRDPKCAEAHAGFANGLRSGGCVDEAIAAYRRSVELRPNHPVTLSNLAFALRDQARFEECEELLRRAMVVRPESAEIHSGLIFTLLMNPRVRPEVVRAEQDAWNARHVEPLRGTWRPPENLHDAGRRLRIGYLSADFRQHPVRRFMLPLLKNHDRGQVEVFCYSATMTPDAFTATLQSAADQWRQITAMNDAQAAKLIRRDRIDILIDLCNHTIGNRLAILAHKPAPVQITYLAYNADSGVRTLDWRMTDPHVDPVLGGAEPAFERPLRLAETYWCYSAEADVPEVGPLPADSAGGAVTFGRLNYSSKVNDDVLELWSRVLSEVPRSRLVLHVPVGSREKYVRDFFAARGVDVARLELVPRMEMRAYFEVYQRIDIGLDPFPWAGGTTSCDALYMGVPVLTKAGTGRQETLSRGGASLLTNLGMGEWIARSAEEYLSRAKAFSGDLAGLRQVRLGLRGRMRGSVLMDASRFARNVEAACREAWRCWCVSAHP